MDWNKYLKGESATTRTVLLAMTATKRLFFTFPGREGVEEFFSCADCFLAQRADVTRAGVPFIQRSNLRVTSISAYRSRRAGLIVDVG